MSTSNDLAFTCSVDDAEDIQAGKPSKAQVFMLGRPMDAAEPDDAAPEHIDGGVLVEVEAPRRRAAADDGDAFENLQRQYNEAQSAREAAERAAASERQTLQAYDAAIKAAQERDTIAAAYHEENSHLADAKRRYSETYDPSIQAELAQEIAVRAQLLARYDEAYSVLSQQAVLPQRQPEPAGDPFESAIVALPETDKQWLRSHRDDIAGNPRREALLRALAIQAELAEEDGGHGLQPGSEEYHSFLNAGMGYDNAEPQPRQARRQGGTARRPMAAPSSRATASSYSRVALSDDHRKMARELKMSDADFSQFVKKSGQGQLGRGVTGGRLHASYSVND